MSVPHDGGRSHGVLVLPFCYAFGMRVTVEIPDSFRQSLIPEGVDPARLLLEDAVAQAYRERRLTMEQVRQLLGYETRMEVDPFLSKYEIYDYTIEEFHKDMATMDRLFRKQTEKTAA